jgi:hypothetical protein
MECYRYMLLIIKAPILVCFESHLRDDEVCLMRMKGKSEKIELEEEENSEKIPRNKKVLNSIYTEDNSTYQISWTKAMKQSLIFKTGDDIRYIRYHKLLLISQ